MRQCKQCGGEIVAGLKGLMCRKCDNERKNISSNKWKIHWESNKLDPDVKQICNGPCGLEKSVVEFPICKTKKNGVKGKCLECYNIESREYYWENKDKYHGYRAKAYAEWKTSDKTELKDILCTNCNLIYPATEFGGLGKWCRKCRNKSDMDRYYRNKDLYKDKTYNYSELKECSSCGKFKTLDYFWKHSGCKDGLNHNCKPCILAYNRLNTHKYKDKKEECFKKWLEEHLIEIVCKNCLCKFDRPECYINEGDNFCSQECSIKYRRGENHPNYIKDRSLVKWPDRTKRMDVRMKEARSECFRRDNYTCNDCYIRGSKLNAHHIITVKKDESKIYDINNLITLCEICHRAIKGKEEEFEQKYSQIAIANTEKYKEKLVEKFATKPLLT